MKEKVWSIVVGVVVGLYVITPDLFPGPIDDAIILALGIFAESRLKNKITAIKEP